MVNTYRKEVYMSGAVEWVSGEFMLHLSDCRAFKTSPQISCNNVSPLLKMCVTQLQAQRETIQCRRFMQPSIHQPLHYCWVSGQEQN